MLCREIIAVCSQIHTKHTNTLCGQNIELLNVKLAVHILTTVRYIVTTGIRRVTNELTRYAHYTDAVHGPNTLQLCITDCTPDIAADEGQRTTVSTGMLKSLDA